MKIVALYYSVIIMFIDLNLLYWLNTKFNKTVIQVIDNYAQQ